MEECNHVFREYYGRMMCKFCNFNKLIKPIFEGGKKRRILQRKREYIIKQLNIQKIPIPEYVTQALKILDNSEPCFETNKKYNDLTITINKLYNLNQKKCLRCVDCQCSECVKYKNKCPKCEDYNEWFEHICIGIYKCVSKCKICNRVRTVHQTIKVSEKQQSNEERKIQLKKYKYIKNMLDKHILPFQKHFDEKNYEKEDAYSIFLNYCILTPAKIPKKEEIDACIKHITEELNKIETDKELNKIVTDKEYNKLAIFVNNFYDFYIKKPYSNETLSIRDSIKHHFICKHMKMYGDDQYYTGSDDITFDHSGRILTTTNKPGCDLYNSGEFKKIIRTFQCDECNICNNNEIKSCIICNTNVNHLNWREWKIHFCMDCQCYKCIKYEDKCSRCENGEGSHLCIGIYNSRVKCNNCNRIRIVHQNSKHKCAVCLDDYKYYLRKK